MADRENHRIQVFDSEGNFIAKWGTQGTGDGELERPYTLIVDRLGYVYVADAGNNRIQVFRPAHANKLYPVDSAGKVAMLWARIRMGNAPR